MPSWLGTVCAHSLSLSSGGSLRLVPPGLCKADLMGWHGSGSQGTVFPHSTHVKISVCGEISKGICSFLIPELKCPGRVIAGLETVDRGVFRAADGAHSPYSFFSLIDGRTWPSRVSSSSRSSQNVSIQNFLSPLDLHHHTAGTRLFKIPWFSSCIWWVSHLQ